MNSNDLKENNDIKNSDIYISFAPKDYKEEINPEKNSENNEIKLMQELKQKINRMNKDKNNNKVKENKNEKNII